MKTTENKFTIQEIEENVRGGRRMIEYMMQAEQLLYHHNQRGGGLTLAILKRELGKRRGSSIGQRTVETIISYMRGAYYAHFNIPPKESILTKRFQNTDDREYILNRGTPLLFPHLLFENEKVRTKFNLMLKAGELFSLPFEAFLEKSGQLDEEAKEIFKDVIDTGYRPYQARVFATIFDAINSKTVIEFQYEAVTQAKDNPGPLTILSPYYLKTYNNKWYLIGHVRQRRQAWNVFALDRIINVKLRPDLPYYEYDVNIINDFYSKVIGFFVPPNADGSFPENASELETIDISIMVKDDKKAYFLSKNPIHHSQIQTKENPLVFHIECIENIHLYQALLRIISDIRWIEPEEIRKKLIQTMEEATLLLKNEL